MTRNSVNFSEIFQKFCFSWCLLFHYNKMKKESKDDPDFKEVGLGNKIRRLAWNDSNTKVFHQKLFQTREWNTSHRFFKNFIVCSQWTMLRVTWILFHVPSLYRPLLLKAMETCRTKNSTTFIVWIIDGVDVFLSAKVERRVGMLKCKIQ